MMTAARSMGIFSSAMATEALFMIASVVFTATMDAFVVNASIFAIVTAMRTPVNEPGPAAMYMCCTS